MCVARLTGPFVLLDDARPGGKARLYERPCDILSARHPDSVPACLDRLRRLEGRHAAGFLCYEAGYALDPKLAPLKTPPPSDAPPLLWFGLFEEAREVSAAAFLPDSSGGWTGPARPLIEAEAYCAAVAGLQRRINAGDIYQANFTFAAEVPIAGDPLALYAGLRARSAAGHGALVHTGDHWLLSLSPELFFSVEEGRITTRPMKGTARRGRTPEEDAAAAHALRHDPKQRAENLMIVDLLRNDLSRVARTGSVDVPDLFTVETYPTVHQMTSTVRAVLEDGRCPVDLLEALFPCGSITGAPKLRAMELLAEAERRHRGVYSGAIGGLAPDGQAEFNVAIRTLVLREGETSASLGLGSGIVADSRAGEEWRECLAKGAFVADPDRRFDLIETMRFDPHDGLFALEAHLGRMKGSADRLGFAFDRHAARNDLQAATFRIAVASRVRLLLSSKGAMAIEVRPLHPPPPEPVAVAIAPLPVSPRDFRLRHKTSDRAFYDAARRASGAFEILFQDDDGALTEGSFTSLFVERDGLLLTPPLTRPLLPGVLRAELIAEGQAREADLYPEDLARGFLIGNASRGLMQAVLK